MPEPSATEAVASDALIRLRAVRFDESEGRAIDVPDHDWVLGGVPSTIVRRRVGWPATPR